jgi:hypothetical protein
MIDIHRAVEHFKIEDDPDVKSIKKTNEQIKQSLIGVAQKQQEAMNKEMN